MTEASITQDQAITESVSYFTQHELCLPYNKWNELQEGRRERLREDVCAWLDQWNAWDLACSPMSDEKRRLIRLGHYLGWFHACSANQHRSDSP